MPRHASLLLTRDVNACFLIIGASRPEPPLFPWQVLGALASIRNHLQRTRTRLHEEQEDHRIVARVEPWTSAAPGGGAGMDVKLPLPKSVYSLTNEMRVRRADAAWQKRVMSWMAWNSQHMKVSSRGFFFPAALCHTTQSPAARRAGSQSSKKNIFQIFLSPSAWQCEDVGTQSRPGAG